MTNEIYQNRTRPNYSTGRCDVNYSSGPSQEVKLTIAHNVTYLRCGHKYLPHPSRSFRLELELQYIKSIYANHEPNGKFCSCCSVIEGGVESGMIEVGV